MPGAINKSNLSKCKMCFRVDCCWLLMSQVCLCSGPWSDEKEYLKDGR